MRRLGIVVYFEALRVAIDCHNCLEIPVPCCIAVERDEQCDLVEGVGGCAGCGGYSCDFDWWGVENMMGGLKTPACPCPFCFVFFLRRDFFAVMGREPK